MEIRKISKYSNIDVFDKFEDLQKTLCLKMRIVQVKIEDGYFACEYVNDDMLESYLLENTKGLTPTDKEAPFDAQPRKTQEEMELETALDTVLNNDPLGRYNGCNLRVPFDKRDEQWVEWVLANMHNKFIKDKVALIKASGYGK